MVTVHRRWFSGNQGWPCRTGEGGSHDIGEKLEGVPVLKAAGSRDSEDSLGESLTILGLVAKAELSPLDCRSNPSLCNIVGGLYPPPNVYKAAPRCDGPYVAACAAPSCLLQKRC